ncbi:MAG: hypothetical protein ACRD3M_18010, partial [Thermoanaerobaculia bacterium]
LERLKQSRQSLAAMDLLYWTFHRELEQGHEDAMSRTLTTLSAQEEGPLRQGCLAALGLLEAFWLGLDSPAPPAEPTF